MPLLLNEKDIVECLPLDEHTLNIAERAFAALRDPATVSPHRKLLATTERDAQLEVRAAQVAGFKWIVVRCTSHWNKKRQSEAQAGSVTQLYNTDDGTLDGLLLGRGHLRAIRGAVCSAIATRYLAKDPVHCLGILGTGQQLKLQIQANLLVRDIRQVLIWGRDFAKAKRLAEKLSAEFGIEIKAEADSSLIAQQADLMISITAAESPIMSGHTLKSGLHITAMGADTPEKQEFDASVYAAIDRIWVDRVSLAEKAGELHHMRQSGYWMETPPELGQVINGKRTGRKDDTEITFCDLTGLAAIDTALANLIMDNAIAKGIGEQFAASY